MTLEVRNRLAAPMIAHKLVNVGRLFFG